jgi:hypothetical protein
MATNLDNLKTRRDAIYVELAALDSTKAGGLPDYSVPEQSVQHVSYRMSLYKELDLINTQLATAEGPWEVRSVGVT